MTRKDLSIGLQAAQAIHAVIEFCLEYPELTRHWHDISNYVVVLAVEDEEDLMKLIEKAKSKGIKTIYFKEPDLDNAITAAIFEPGIASRKLTSSIGLMGKL